MAPSPPELQTIHDVIVGIAREAGQGILKAIESGGTVLDSKTNSIDLVTNVDKDTEDLIRSRLNKHFPDYAFVGEETHDKSPVPMDGAFVVDPVDGTTSFVHQFPYFSVCIGFAYDRQPLVGVVYNPMRNELYSGLLGKGAWKNSMPIRSKRPLGTLNESLLILEWGSERANKNFETKKEVFTDFADRARSIRSLGSACLNLCNVAEGVCDAYWEGGCYAWDVCAAWPILLEAGGIMLHGNESDGEVEIDSRVYLAVRGGPNQDQLIGEIRKVIDGRRLDY